MYFVTIRQNNVKRQEDSDYFTNMRFINILYKIFYLYAP